MNIFKAIIKYKGTNFYGWQVQPGLPTIQGELNRALKVMTKNLLFKTKGSGRTDKGVHALGQVVRIEMPFEIEPLALKKALNSLLCEDIMVESIFFEDSTFCPIRSAISKEYRYYFSNTRLRSPFISPFVANSPKGVNLTQLQEALSLFVGKHDFLNYFCVGTDVKSTVREIYRCEIHKKSPPFLTSQEEIFEIVIEGEGFLKQMVRLIVGTCWEYARGVLSKDELLESFQKKLPQKLGPVAPAKGLFLYSVKYK